MRALDNIIQSAHQRRGPAASSKDRALTHSQQGRSTDEPRLPRMAASVARMPHRVQGWTPIETAAAGKEAGCRQRTHHTSPSPRPSCQRYSHFAGDEHCPAMQTTPPGQGQRRTCNCVSNLHGGVDPSDRVSSQQQAARAASEPNETLGCYHPHSTRVHPPARGKRQPKGFEGIAV